MASKLFEIKTPSPKFFFTGSYLSVILMNFSLTGPINSKAGSIYYSGLFVSMVVLMMAMYVSFLLTQ